MCSSIDLLCEIWYHINIGSSAPLIGRYGGNRETPLNVIRNKIISVARRLEQNVHYMKTITQIGRTALTRLFNADVQHSDDGKVSTYTKVSFPKGEYDLSQIPKERSISDHMYYPQKYFIWSIELGLFQLELQFTESILNSIVNVAKTPRRTKFEDEYNITKEPIIPSHLIFFESSSNSDTDHSIVDDDYKVYRLTPTQELAIKLLIESL